LWANYIDTIQLHVAGRPENYQRVVQQMLADIDPNLTVPKSMIMEELVSGSFNSPRLMAQLTSLYGIVALILASIGLYGVAAYMVARRTGEIGIRMALGAQATDVGRFVVRGGMTPVAIGLTFGVVGAIVAGRLVRSLMYSVSATDPLTIAGVALVVMCAAALACYVPARRAMRVDPMVALRYE
jgi:ABC-type antimicrobial peptide transport system permease subunit